MKLLRSFCIAFSTYSKIPMPQFEWKQEDMRYTLLFFPWIGAVIGALCCGWNLLCVRMGIGDCARSLVMAAIPILVTGGFHIDGYMDTMDALHSYQSREKKLEILKDAHIGAFSVIMLALLGLLFVAACSELRTEASIAILGCGFVLSRAFSGLSLVYFCSAKQNGSLYIVAEAASRKWIRVGLWITVFLCVAVMFIFGWKQALVATVVTILSFFYYHYKSNKEFGGITGDLAGYFVCICECSIAVGLVICELLERGM
ncbi:MAG: adenosylcobinamide-GDP ribazoletransferase [Eubacteriales bacterium]|nr:adenosylcobinamide-GDP ribazoletransferase [Eubacteriales bacterium]